MSWEKFDKNFDENFLNDVNEQAKKGNTFEELPLGKYEVAIDSMELTESKAGDPMVKYCFTVVQGDYEGRKIFRNQLVYKGDEHDKKRIGAELTFLKKLGTSRTISFEGFAKFDNLIKEVFKEIDKVGLEYLLEIKENKGYRYFDIVEVFEPESEETPF